ncbi:MAG: LptF/LptG family permease [Planctomycetota bacterium]
MLTLQRYVLRSLFFNFLVTLIVITGVFFIAGCVRVLYSKAGAPDVVSFLRLVPLLMIQTSSVTVPMSLLVAVVVSYGRLASDNEMIGVLMGGIHPYWVLSPAILLGLCLSAVNLFVNTEFVPRARELRDALVKQSVNALLQTLNADDNNLKIGDLRMHYRLRDEEGWFHDVSIYLLKSGKDDVHRLQPGFPIRAARARPTVDTERNSISVVLLDWEGESEAGQKRLTRVSSDRFRLDLSLPELFAERERDRNVDELSTLELLLYRATNLELRYFTYRYTLEYHKRIANAFACLVFVFIGAPLGIFFRRGGQLEAFLVSFLLVMIFYYPFMVAGDTLASNGKIPAVVGAWLADGVSLLVGGGLVWKLFRS